MEERRLRNSDGHNVYWRHPLKQQIMASFQFLFLLIIV